MFKYISTFLIFISLLFSNNIKSQGVSTFDSNNYNKWVQTDNTQGSFYINTSTNFISKDGYYYFNIYFYSNASDNYGYLTAAYIENVTVSILVYDYISKKNIWKPVWSTPYVLVQPKSNYSDGINYIAYVYSTNAYQKIKITWTKSSPY